MISLAMAYDLGRADGLKLAEAAAIGEARWMERAVTAESALREIVRKADDRKGMGDFGGSADAYLDAIRDCANAALADNKRGEK